MDATICQGLEAGQVNIKETLLHMTTQVLEVRMNSSQPGGYMYLNKPTQTVSGAQLLERIRSTSCPEKSAQADFRQNHDDSRCATLKVAHPGGDTPPVSDSAMTWWGFQSRSHKPLHMNKFCETCEALSATLPSRRRTTPVTSQLRDSESSFAVTKSTFHSIRLPAPQHVPP